MINIVYEFIEINEDIKNKFIENAEFVLNQSKYNTNKIMLETRILRTPAKFESDDLSPILNALSTEGWTPAIWESEKKFLQLAGVDQKNIKTIRKSIDPYRRHYPIIYGDIFFRESETYYIIINLGDIAADKRGRIIRDFGDGESSLEIGIVSSDSDGPDERLSVFAESVEKAIKLCLDGRKTRYMNLEWNEVKPGTPRLDDITSISKEESGTKFIRAKLKTPEIKAAKVLSNELARNLLIELKQAGFAREQDILSRRAKLKDKVKEELENLKNCELIKTEFLLECKRTRTPLTKLSNHEQLKNDNVATLICPACGIKFSEELLSEGYSVSELGRRLSIQSNWMTMWITELLVKLGVPEEAILWNISENGEEVDLLVEFLERLWIFELKDREFGAGDSHPLNYRQVRYKADGAIIVTTDKVSKDAKRVFKELLTESGQRRNRQGPTYIEGLNNAENSLSLEISNISLRYAHKRLAMLGESSGYNLGAVLEARLGETIKMIEEDNDNVL